MKEEGVDITAADFSSENAMLKVSRAKPAEFQLITAAII